MCELIPVYGSSGLDWDAYIKSLHTLTPGDAMHGEIELISDEHTLRSWAGAALGVVYEDPYIVLFRDLVRFPSGALGTYLRIALHPVDSNAGVLFIPRMGEDFVLIRAFRHAVRRWSLEFPRGFLPIGLDLVSAAKAELREEAGLSADQAHWLGTVCPDTGLLSARIHIFEGQVQSAGPSQPEPTEAVGGGLLRVNAQELRELIGRRDIFDGITLSAFMLSQSGETRINES